MKIGVPTEIKAHEYRVGLTPESASERIRDGHDVVIQSNAAGCDGGAPIIFLISA